MEYQIYVGTVLKIKIGFMSGSFKVMYCGMPNENTFTLAPFIIQGYQGFSTNVFYHIDTRVIKVNDREFEVIEVTPDYIVLAD